MLIDVTHLPRLVVSGVVDFTNADQMLAAVESAVAGGSRDVALDLSEAEVLDSSALRVMLKCRKLVEEAGYKLRIEGAGDDVIRMLQLNGFAPLFDLPMLKREAASSDGPRLQYIDWNMYESIAVSGPDMIKPLRDVAIAAAIEAGLDEQTLGDIRIALGEALANAVRHGSPKDGSGRVRLKCLSCSRAIVFEVSDEGEGFDFEDVVASSPGDEGDEGLGLRLIAKVMDEVECNHIETGNRVRMIKWIENDRSSIP